MLLILFWKVPFLDFFLQNCHFFNYHSLLTFSLLGFYPQLLDTMSITIPCSHCLELRDKFLGIFFPLPFPFFFLIFFPPQQKNQKNPSCSLSKSAPKQSKRETLLFFVVESPLEWLELTQLHLMLPFLMLL